MKTIIKIVLALVILNAAAQAGMAAFTYYQFQDAMHETVQFARPNSTDEETTADIMNLANDYGLPVDAGSISVGRVGADRIVSCSYTTDVVLVPGVFTKPWTFTPRTSVRMLGGGSLKR